MKFLKKENALTYDALMNSHFMKYPSHPRWLHTLCNPVVVVIISLGIIITAGSILDIDSKLLLLVATLAGVYWPYRQYSAHIQMAGHGVGIIKKSKFSFLGFTKIHSIVTVFMLVVVLLMVLLCFSENFGDPKTNANFRFFGIAVLVSFVGSLLSWRFHTYYETWYGDEYTARVQFKKKGFSERQIEDKISILRVRGVLPPYVKK